MQKKFLLRTFLVLLCLGIVYACVETDVFDLEKKRVSKEVSAAQTWFDANVGELTMELLTSDSDEKESRIMKPDWTKTVSHQNSDYKFTEVKLESEQAVGFVSPECLAKYEETGDQQYLSHILRLVVRTDRKTSATDAFIMVAYPDLSYIEEYGSMKDVNYLDRKDFSGMVYYHHIDGSVANGWLYFNGVPNEVDLSDIKLLTPSTMMRCSDPKVTEHCYYIFLVTTYYSYEVKSEVWIMETADTKVIYLGTVCNPCVKDTGTPSGTGGKGNNGGYVNPAKWAPKASKLFKNSNLTEDEWKELEEMVEDIEKDCMGSELLSAIENSYSFMTGKSLEFYFSYSNTYYPNSTAPYYNSSTVTLTSDASASSLLHELFHVYQNCNFNGNVSQWNSSVLNYEAEAHFAKYLYLKRQSGYAGSTAQTNYENFEPFKSVRETENFFDSKGNCLNELALNNHTSNRIAAALYEVGGYKEAFQNRPFTDLFNYSISGSATFSNISQLSKNC